MLGLVQISNKFSLIFFFKLIINSCSDKVRWWGKNILDVEEEEMPFWGVVEINAPRVFPAASHFQKKIQNEGVGHLICFLTTTKTKMIFTN